MCCWQDMEKPLDQARLFYSVRNPLGAIFQDERRRAAFDDGLRRVFPTPDGLPPAEIKKLLQRLRETMDGPRKN
jgi:hypothetical protein